MRPVVAALVMGLGLMQGAAAQQNEVAMPHALPPAGVSCAHWTDARAKEKMAPGMSDLLTSYVMGFLSGVEFMTVPKISHSTLTPTSVDTVQVAVDNYCREHPTSALGVAAADLALKMMVPKQPGAAK
jgi:hypothetical protein